jgi:hypothetical protein
LARVLRDDTVLREIDASESFMGDEGCSAICEALRFNKSLLALNVRGGNIGRDGAVAVGHMLRANHTLHRLSLEWNPTGALESGIEAIAEGLASNMGLKHIDLRNNRISAEGAASFFRLLKTNQHLESLDMRWNSLGQLGGRALVELLDTNVTLIDVQYAGNQIPYDTASNIERLLARNRDNQNELNRSVRIVEEVARERTVRKDVEMEALRSQLTARHEEAAEHVRQLEDSLSQEKVRRHRLDEELVRTEAERGRLEERSRDQERNLRLAEERVKRLEDEVTVLKQSNMRLRQETETMGAELARERERGSLEKSSLRQRLEEMEGSQRSIRERDRLVSGLESELTEVRRECQRLQEEVRMRTKEQEYLESELAIKEARARQVEEQMRIMEQRMRTAEEESKGMRAQTQRATRELEDQIQRVLAERADVERAWKTKADDAETARQTLHREMQAYEREALAMKRQLEEETMVVRRALEASELQRKKLEKDVEDLRLMVKRAEYAADTARRAEHDSRANAEAQQLAAKDRIEELLVAQSRLATEFEDRMRQKDGAISVLQDEIAAQRREHARLVQEQEKIVQNLEVNLASSMRNLFVEARRHSGAL